MIKGLTVGKSYMMTETKPADGYVTAESITFTVENTAEIQKQEMKDDVTKVLISKQDIAGKELPGAKLTILDEDGKVVEKLDIYRRGTLYRDASDRKVHAQGRNGTGRLSGCKGCGILK